MRSDTSILYFSGESSTCPYLCWSWKRLGSTVIYRIFDKKSTRNGTTGRNCTLEYYTRNDSYLNDSDTRYTGTVPFSRSGTSSFVRNFNVGLSSILDILQRWWHIFITHLYSRMCLFNDPECPNPLENQIINLCGKLTSNGTTGPNSTRFQFWV